MATGRITDRHWTRETDVSNEHKWPKTNEHVAHFVVDIHTVIGRLLANKYEKQGEKAPDYNESDSSYQRA